MNSIVNSIASEYLRTDLPAFKAGDRITVHYKIKEGAKERIQLFQGDVIQRRNAGIDETFTVRKISNSVGVERVFPFNLPTLVKVENLQKGRVRRSRLFYLRAAIGKAARIREKKFIKKLDSSLKGIKRKTTWSWETEKKFS